LRRTSEDMTKFARAYVTTGDPIDEDRYYMIMDIRNGKRARPANYERFNWDLVNARKLPVEAGAQAVPLIELMKRAGFTEQELAKMKEALSITDQLTHRDHRLPRRQGRVRRRRGQVHRDRCAQPGHGAGVGVRPDLPRPVRQGDESGQRFPAPGG
jgi:hypothetical protein